MNFPGGINHFTITQASLIALVHEVGGLVVAFGIVNNTTVGIMITAAVSLVNLAFLIGNSLHTTAHARVVSAKGPQLAAAPTPAPVAPVVK